MKLDRVTITGADDSVTPEQLADLSREFPFVEWAILFSQRHQGTQRWPSPDWLLRLQGVAKQNPMDLSAHLCGGWVRDVLAGRLAFADWFGAMFDDYRRVQLNFHAEPQFANTPELAGALCANGLINSCGAMRRTVERQFIFQIDGVNDKLLQSTRAMASQIDAVPLFDQSHGAGVLPEGAWPKAEYRNANRELLYHGYAGGLGPDTLEAQLPLIAEAAGDARIWIDMESRVRSDEDRVFNLAKVRRCLEIAAPFVTPEARQ